MAIMLKSETGSLIPIDISNVAFECVVWADPPAADVEVDYKDGSLTANSREHGSAEVPVTYVPPKSERRVIVREVPAKRTHSQNVSMFMGQLEVFSATDDEIADHRERKLEQIQNCKLKCDSCCIMFKSQKKLADHNQSYHSDAAGPYECGICNCRFKRVSTLIEHRDGHYTMYRCLYDGCAHFGDSSRAVREHYRRAHERESAQSGVSQYQWYALPQQYECRNCGEQFETREDIQQHMRSCQLKFICDICGQGCATKAQWETHCQEHAKPHECEVCQKRFNETKDLLAHARTHTAGQIFSCLTCNKDFTSSAQLQVHCHQHHADGGSVEEEKPKRRGRGLARKKTAQPNESLTGSEQGGETFECTVCNKILKSMKGLQAHLQRHDMPLKECDQCDRSFRYMSQLKLHKLTHTGEKPFECTECGSRFYTKSQMTIHLKGHSDLRPYQCDECNMSFKYTANLYTHKFIHRGEKPHVCTVCGARFTMKGNLTGHMKTHTNDKPFVCNLCGRQFPWRRNLKNHYKTHL